MNEKSLKVFAAFKLFVNSYYTLSESNYLLLMSLAQFKEVKKNEILLPIGAVSKQLYYIYHGAVIAYFMDELGNTYNKNIFLEDRFAGSTVSALLKAPSEFTLQAIENTTVLSFNYDSYKELINSNDELKKFYIAYIEKNWVIEKEKREISIVMESARVRYQKLLKEYPSIDQRVALHHIASNLGITPTQLSRIRKDLKENNQSQHMLRD